MPSRRWASSNGNTTGYNGVFGDSFWSDCWDIMDTRGGKRIVQENITQEIPEGKVKPWFRKTHLSHFNEDDIYQVMLEVSNFSSSDISVKLVNDKTVIVEGKHGERKDKEGYVSREFTRKYELPEKVDPSTLECLLSRDGVLVIRGHAPRNQRQRTFSPNGKLTPEQVHDQRGEPIPIYTHGYQHARHSSGNSATSTTSQKERIIPISQENGYQKQTMSKTEVHDDHPHISSVHSSVSNRSSSRSSDHATPKEQHRNDHEAKEKDGRRSRTVSFNDDDTIASNSPIIEEPPSTASNGPTPSPQPGTSRKSPSPLSRQENFDNGSFSEYRSSSRMSEERYRQSSTPDYNSSKTAGKNMDIFKQDLDSKHNDLFGNHLGKDLLRSKSPLEDIDKYHKDLIERTRQLSRESLDRMHKESEKWMESVRKRSPLFHHRSIDNIFDSPLSRRIDEPLLWDPKIPPVSKEEQYEKKHEKGYDKDGKMRETTEEKMFQQYYSSSGSPNGFGRFKEGTDQKALEHPINITSAA